MPRATAARSSSGVRAMPPPVPPSVNAGRTIAGSGNSTGPCAITVSSDQKVTAAFAHKHALIVTRNGTGTGTVTSSPAGIVEMLDDPAVSALATEYRRTPAQVILRWEVQQGIVTIPKSTDPERQRINASVFDFELSDHAMERLDALDRGEGAAADSDRHEEF